MCFLTPFLKKNMAQVKLDSMNPIPKFRACENPTKKYINNHLDQEDSLIFSQISGLQDPKKKHNHGSKHLDEDVDSNSP